MTAIVESAYIKTLTLLLLLLQPLVVVAQSAVEHRQQNRPDTLTLADRFSLKTNTVDWVLLVPNLQVEFDLGSTNHSHWTLGFGGRYNWQTKHTFNPAQKYNIMEGRMELRYYWRTREIDSIYFPAHRKHNYLGRLLSTRRYGLKHPNTTYYRGVYVSADKFSLLLGKEGFQGKAVTAGLTYGIIKPLYVFSNGSSLDLDFGVSAGICCTQNNKFHYDRERDRYTTTEWNKLHIVPFPVLSDARVAFVYRIGKYPVTKKYRWRYEVDLDHRTAWDERASAKAQKKKEKEMTLKSMEDLEEAFDEYYDAIYQRTFQTGANIEDTNMKPKGSKTQKDKRKRR